MLTYVTNIVIIISLIISIYYTLNFYKFTENVDFIKPETVNVKFSDIVGLEKQKESINKVLNATEKPNGILLYGPPGTGKTMLAKAIATKYNGKFLNITPSMLQSKFYGETSKLIDNLFESARKNSPCILFFDEMDGLFASRSLVFDNNDRLLKTTLLSNMDGMKTNENILLIGATNRLYDLDEAILRRFRMQIEINLPEYDTIKNLLLSNEINDDIINKIYDKRLSCSDINQLNIFVKLETSITNESYDKCLSMFF